jgi:DNA-binding protein HU-beta
LGPGKTPCIQIARTQISPLDQRIFDDSSPQIAAEGSSTMKKVPMSIPRVASAKKPKTETVTLRHLAMALAESHDLKKAQVNAMLMGMVEDIATHLRKGRRIRINGLGIIQVRKRKARMGRNPATGEAIKIKASKKIAFRAAKDLKEAI